MLIHRILCRDDKELIAQRIPPRVHRHLPFGHRFEQRTLSTRCRAVNFVSQQNIGEDRAFAELKFVTALIENVETRNIAGKQIGRALTASESATNSRRQRFCERGLSEPRLVFEQQMTVGQKTNQNELNDVRLASQR